MIGRYRRAFPQWRVRISIVLTLAVLVTAAACAHQPTSNTPGAPGFFMGLVHGFLIGFSFVGSLFSDVRIYEFPNSGGWYDLGYLIGASGFLGGGGRAAR